MSKGEIAQELSERGLGGKRLIMNVLDGLAELAAEETAAGEDFLVPGICKISWAYAPAQAKGARWHKGDEVVGFGGITQVKESDSPARKQRVKLAVRLAGAVGKNRVSSKEMSTFLRSKPGKNVISRKSK